MDLKKLANIVFATILVADIVTTAMGATFVVTETDIVFLRRGIFRTHWDMPAKV